MLPGLLANKEAYWNTFVFLAVFTCMDIDNICGLASFVECCLLRVLFQLLCVVG